MRRARAHFKLFWGLMRNDYSCDDTLTELIICHYQQFCGQCECHIRPQTDDDGSLRCSHCRSKFIWLVDIEGMSSLGTRLLEKHGSELKLTETTPDHLQIVNRQQPHRRVKVAR